jgi:hypothetical protein
MKDFLFYMLFSGFEYLAIFFLIFGFFNLSFKYFSKEMILGVFLITFTSYILVRYNLAETFPLPLILIPLTVLILVKIFKQGVLRSIILSVAGFVVYGGIQFIIAIVLVKLQYMTATDLHFSFSIKSYTMQTICGFLAIAIGLYIKLTNGGFGFTMSKRISGRKGFVIISVCLVLVCSIACLGFYTFASVALLLLSLTVIIISIMILFYLSYKRDLYEYS